MTTNVAINVSLQGLTAVSKAFDVMETKTKGLGSALKSAGDASISFGKSMTTYVTAPLTAAAVASGKLASDVETNFSRIEGLVGIAADQVEVLKQGVLDLGGATAKSPIELSDALFTVTSAGFRGQEAMDVLTAAAKASTAGLGETRAIAEAVTGSINAYGSASLSASESVEIITATARAGNFATEQLAGSLGRVTPFAQAAQVSFEDVGGSIALLTRVNNDANESITQISGLLRAFSAPTTQTIKALDELGLSTTAVRDSMGENGLVATLRMLDDRLGGNRDKLRELVPDSQAFSAAIQILNADAETIEGTFGQVANSAGILDEAFSAAARTSGFTFAQSFSALKVAMIQLGDVILPMVVPFVQSFTGAIMAATDAFTGLSPEVQQTAIQIAAAFGVGGPAFIAVGLFTKVVGIAIETMGPLFAKAGKMMVNTLIAVGKRFVVLAAAGGAIALVAAAIVGLVGVWQRWGDEISAVTAQTLERTSEWFVGFKDASTKIWENTTGALKRVFIDPFADLFSQLGPVIEKVAGWFTWLAEKIGVDVGAISDFVGEKFGEIQVNIKEATDDTVAFVAGAYEGLSENIDVIVDETVKTFEIGWQTISDTTSELVGGIVTDTTNDFDTMSMDITQTLGTLRAQSTAIVEGMGADLTGSVGNTTGTVEGQVDDMAKNTTGIAISWKGKMGETVEGMANGWLDSITILDKGTRITMGDLFNFTINETEGWIAQIGKLFGSLFSGFGELFSGLGSLFGMGGGGAGGGLGGLGSIFGDLGSTFSGGAGFSSGLGALGGSIAAFGAVTKIADSITGGGDRLFNLANGLALPQTGLERLLAMRGEGGKALIDAQAAAFRQQLFPQFARGTDMVVSQPQLIQVGERGSERVSVTPLGATGSSQSQGGQIVIQGPTIFDEISMSRFERRLLRNRPKAF